MLGCSGQGAWLAYEWPSENVNRTLYLRKLRFGTIRAVDFARWSKSPSTRMPRTGRPSSSADTSPMSLRICPTAFWPAVPLFSSITTVALERSRAVMSMKPESTVRSAPVVDDLETCRQLSDLDPKGGLHVALESELTPEVLVAGASASGAFGDEASSSACTPAVSRNLRYRSTAFR